MTTKISSDVIQTGTINNDQLAGNISQDKLAGNISQSKLAGAIPISKLSSTGTASSNTFLRGDGSWQAAGGFSNMQVFTSSGTWTNPGSVTKVKVTVIGGGGGGGIANWPFGFFSGGAGGGTAIETLTIPTAPVPITVGGGGAGHTYPIPAPSAANYAASGGTSSFGEFCSATGGTGGAGYGGSFPSIPSPSLPGYYRKSNGGVGTGGTININGTHTVSSGASPSGAAIFGGGVSCFSFPTSGPTAPRTPANWADAVVYGAGGGCTSSPAMSPVWRAGNGGDGVVIVEY